MQAGTSVRSVCGRVRIAYDPTWSQIQPYLIYVEGTQTVNAKTLDKAVELCEHKYRVKFCQDKIENAKSSN